MYITIGLILGIAFMVFYLTALLHRPLRLRLINMKLMSENLDPSTKDRFAEVGLSLFFHLIITVVGGVIMWFLWVIILPLMVITYLYFNSINKY